MTHKWILDVLSDLKTFAKDNDLPVLAGQLEDVAIVAMAEMASKPQPDPVPCEDFSDDAVVRQFSSYARSGPRPCRSASRV